MRVSASDNPELEAFDQLTLAIRNGSVMNKAVTIPAETVTEIKPNSKEKSTSEAIAMKKFCQQVLPDIQTKYAKPS